MEFYKSLVMFLLPYVIILYLGIRLLGLSSFFLLSSVALFLDYTMRGNQSVTTEFMGYLLQIYELFIQKEKVEEKVNEQEEKKILSDLEKALLGKSNSKNDYDPYSEERGKSGYCYIGTDDNFRSCIKVGDNSICMSEDIFPTMDICINPNLRQ
uniref:Uncharacterized protein n=1 Tax=viral metagenome TaxID=1070528 RepID=A0A6C0KI32_9ZZZZ